MSLLQGNHTESDKGLLTGKRVHLAVPVRWSLVAEQGRGPVETACTYDIHPHGARLLSARRLNIGDMVVVERGRNKAVCQVVWSAESGSPLHGQFTVRCVDGKTPWEDELRQLEEQFQPAILDGFERSQWARASIRPVGNRRRRPRFHVEGQAQVTDGAQGVGGELQQISEYGARIISPEPLKPGTGFRLMLNVFDVSVALKAQVKYLIDNLSMGVEFQEIRRGDRPLLSYVLSKAKTRRVEEFAEVEVVTESLASVAV